MNDMDGMDEVIAEFLVESHENLDRLDREFVELEHDPNSRQILASIFRTIHTIKGTAGFLGFDRLGAVSHEGESLLSLLRDGTILLTPAMTSTLLAMVDAVRQMLTAIEQTGADGDNDYPKLVADLVAFIAGEGAAPEAVLETGDELVPVAALPEPEAPVAVSPDAAVAAPAATDTPFTSMADSSIRVDVRLLDQLMNLVGELVLARNQILQYTATQLDQTFLTTSQQLNLITTELQEGVMKTRMQPIGNVWSKFPRVVRDLALQCNKSVRIEMEGEETELDKTILEAIKDPLTHVIRNSVDHGIEDPDTRTAAGKAAEGTIRLCAFHEGGQVIIEISDDGGGLDNARIQSKAIERGLITSQAAARMSEREISNLIFLPGFSTAAAVTNVSGRGVGMDVVKTNIEKIGGTVDIHSRFGQGTTLTVKIPLTLAIIPALVVGCDTDRYAIPQVNLVELLRLDPEQVAAGIETVGGAPVYRLRGRLLPIVHLRDVLGYPATAEGDGETAETEATAWNIVVLQAGARDFGLVVDQISDTEEIVVKPLGRHLKATRTYAGATIMGDGAVALILDAMGIGQQANVLSELNKKADGESTGSPAERRGDTQTVIVCTVGHQRIALPLHLVDRLEEFPRDSVERTAGQDVIPYRDRLLTLVPLDQLIDAGGPAAEADEDSPLQVLVYTHGDRVYGLIVDAIIDIIDADRSVGHEARSANVEFSAVVGRRVTDLLQVDAIIDAFEAAHGALALTT